MMDWQQDEVQQLAQLCLDKQLMIATAESCTGGLVSACITEMAGSSQWFDRGFVTYSNEAKMTELNVQAKTLYMHGAVSEETALEMAKGAVKNCNANLAVSISGVAGPGGGSAEKPVGMVCFSVSSPHGTRAETQYFDGDRHQVRQAACAHALKMLNQEALK